MTSQVVSLQLPNDLYDKLQFLSASKRKNPVDIVAQLITAAYDEQLTKSYTPASQNILKNTADLGVTDLHEERDPVLDLIGAYHSEVPLIDNIPVSEDPDLYLLAEAMGRDADDLHAWEIAPARYAKDNEGRSVRRKRSDEV
jgi:hypothetical protein